MAHRIEINAETREELIITLHGILREAIAAERGHTGLRLVHAGSEKRMRKLPLPRTRAELTLAIIGTLGPYHRVMELQRAECWTEAPVSPAAAREALDATKAMLAEIMAPASVLD